MTVKTFDDLKKEVIGQDLCNSCGACLAVCTSNNINALCIKDNKPEYREDFKESELIKKCLECGICYLICGQIQKLNSEIETLYSTEFPIGNYKYLTSARTTDLEIQNNAQDGGIVTSILKYLLEKNLVDGVVANQPLDNWESVPQLITSADELIKTAGTRYSILPTVQALGDHKILPKENPKLAFVGTPCQIQTIRKMQALKIRPGVYVKYLIGLFCMENFDYKSLMKAKIENELKYNLNDIKKLNIKGNFFITLKNNKQVEIPLKDISNLVRNNCHYCIDFSNVYADISVGGVGSPPGYSTVLVRTEIGGKLFSKLIIEKKVEELDKESLDLVQFKRDILSQIEKLGKNKYDRGIKKRGMK